MHILLFSLWNLIILAGYCNLHSSWNNTFQIWSELDRQSILTTLSELFISPKCVMDICSYFRPLVLDIAERTKNSILRQGHSNSRLCHKFAVALGLALRICPELKRFVVIHKPYLFFIIKYTIHLKIYQKKL